MVQFEHEMTSIYSCVDSFVPGYQHCLEKSWRLWDTVGYGTYLEHLGNREGKVLRPGTDFLWPLLSLSVLLLSDHPHLKAQLHHSLHMVEPAVTG